MEELIKAADQHMAIIGKTGSGKSYAARRVVEHLLDLDRRVCILDYTGVWWGLRSFSRGRGGYPVVIFGGDKHDVPLNDTMGSPLGRWVAENDVPCIIDMDGMTIGAQHRFVTAFLESLYQYNRRTLHLVIEEIDEFAPQTTVHGMERLVGAVSRIFQRGRKKGFRAIAITQRPANCHKRILAQCNGLIAMRLVAPQDRKAVSEWIRGQADEESGKGVINSLPNLPIGECWLWFPELDILSTYKFDRIKTLDTMKAPEHSDDSKPVQLTRINLDEIRKTFSDAIEKASQDDPVVLKKKLAELRAEMARSKPETIVKEVVREVITADTFSRLKEIMSDLAKMISSMEAAQNELKTLIKKIPDEAPPYVLPQQRIAAPKTQHKDSENFSSHLPSTATDGIKLSAGERRILSVLASYTSSGSGMYVKKLALLAGLAPRSGTFNTYLSRLRTYGLISGSKNDTKLTSKGASIADQSGADINCVEHWSNYLGSSGAGRMFRALLSSAEMTRHELAEAAGLSHTSGTFNTYLSKLRTLDLVRDNRGLISISPHLEASR